jgi:hypothetical protein
MLKDIISVYILLKILMIILSFFDKISITLTYAIKIYLSYILISCIKDMIYDTYINKKYELIKKILYFFTGFLLALIL